jgi:hypothetical protein
MQTDSVIALCVLCALIVFLVAFCIYYDRKLKLFRQSLVPGMEVAVWDTADGDYICATISSLNHYTGDVYVVLRYEKNCRLYPIDSIYQKTVANEKHETAHA